jgi:choline-glycine betaine transporter
VLLAAGGLSSLQTASLVAALPFTVLLLLLMLAIVKLLRHEPLPIRKADLRRYQRLTEAAEAAAEKEAERELREAKEAAQKVFEAERARHRAREGQARPEKEGGGE